MRFTGTLQISIITALLAFIPLSVEAERRQKPVTKCPHHYRKYKDDLRQTWCMDDARRSYTPENAKYVARLSAKNKQSKKRITTDLANR
jgi:hypothetical protein